MEERESRCLSTFSVEPGRLLLWEVAKMDVRAGACSSSSCTPAPFQTQQTMPGLLWNNPCQAFTYPSSSSPSISKEDLPDLGKPWLTKTDGYSTAPPQTYISHIYTTQSYTLNLTRPKFTRSQIYTTPKFTRLIFTRSNLHNPKFTQNLHDPSFT